MCVVSIPVLVNLRLGAILPVGDPCKCLVRSQFLFW